jgi:hypothetical protein
MAKKPHPGHHPGGGRTTPKGTRPSGSAGSHRGPGHGELPRAPRIDPAAHQTAAHGAHAPVRAGHNRGQR